MSLVQADVTGPSGDKDNVIIANALAVAGAVTVYSTPHKLAGADNVGFWIEAASAGTVPVDVKVYVQVSYNYGKEYADIEDVPLLITLGDTNPHPVATQLPYNGYLRLKFVGQAGNPADVTIDAIMCRGN